MAAPTIGRPVRFFFLMAVWTAMLVSQLNQPVSAESTFSALAERLAALAHPTRIKLASMLCEHPAGTECGRVLASTIGISETTISHHLRQLRRAGLIESQRRGMSVYHSPMPQLKMLCDLLLVEGSR